MAAPIPGPITVEQFWGARVVPDVIDQFADKVLEIRVHYGEVEIANGVKLRVAQATRRPHVEFPDRDFGDHLYSLVTVDPDEPSPESPTLRHFVHWVVTNIPGSTPPSREIWEEGQEVVPYMGPAPPIGEHRYVFLTYRQPGKLDIKEQLERENFNLKGFAQKHNLGHPVAGVYFTAKHGDDLDYSERQVQP